MIIFLFVNIIYLLNFIYLFNVIQLFYNSPIIYLHVASFNLEYTPVCGFRALYKINIIMKLLV